VSRRTAAAERFASSPLPSTDEEVWRYSRIADLDLDAFGPVRPPPQRSVPVAVTALLDQLGPRAATVVVRNGWPVLVELAADVADRGVRVAPVADLDDGEEVLGAVATDPADVFGLANDAFAPSPIVLDVPRGVVVTDPVVVVDWIDEADAAVFDRLVVRTGDDAEVRVLEWHGSDDVVALAAPVTELDAASSSRLHHLLVQDRAASVTQIANVASRAGRDATLVSSQAGLGGDYARVRADCRLVGRGATGELAAVYFGVGSQTLDFRTFQEHVAPDTTSNLLFKGAVGGHSRSVYTGLIKVDKAARGTNAFQTNRNLKLSDHAWAESVPNLEIENNDVRCSHASTVGPIDEDQRFYLESRGVPPEVAERLVVAGFFEEVLAGLPVPGAVPLLRSRIAERLAQEED
jgi:Fe-S cluster assembly protein SufD